jgi:hypothetical protein
MMHQERPQVGARCALKQKDNQEREQRRKTYASIPIWKEVGFRKEHKRK